MGLAWDLEVKVMNIRISWVSGEFSIKKMDILRDRGFWVEIGGKRDGYLERSWDLRGNGPKLSFQWELGGFWCVTSSISTPFPPLLIAVHFPRK